MPPVGGQPLGGARHRQSHPKVDAAQWNRRHTGGLANPGDEAHALEQVIVEAIHHRSLAIGRPHQPDLLRQHGTVETQVHMLQVPQALQQHAAAKQQQGCGGQLQRRSIPAADGPHLVHCSRSGRQSRSSCVRIQARGPPARYQSRQQQDRGSDPGGPGHREQVDADLVDPRHLRRQDRTHHLLQQARRPATAVPTAIAVNIANSVRT